MIICMNLSGTKYYNDNVLPQWPNAKELRISAIGQTKFFVVHRRKINILQNVLKNARI
jgi:hypothetical protein